VTHVTDSKTPTATPALTLYLSASINLGTDLLYALRKSMTDGSLCEKPTDTDAEQQQRHATNTTNVQKERTKSTQEHQLETDVLFRSS